MTTENSNTGSNESNTETFIITEFKSGGIDTVKSFLENNFLTYSSEINAEVPQIDSEDGRKRIKALGAEINKKLAEVDSPMRDYLRDIKKQPKLIEAIAKENKEKFTKLRADILKPLEEAQEGQNVILQMLNDVPVNCALPGITSKELKAIIKHTEECSLDSVWPELKKKFKVAHENALTTARVTLERVEAQESQEAELAELRRKAAAAEQAERDRKVAEEAAESARKLEQQKAQKEREDVERRAVEAKQREEAAKQAEAKAIRDAELAEERRAQEVEAAKQREAQAKIDAEAAAKRQAEQAAAAERKAIADEEARQKREAQQRENDKKHRTTINRRNLAVLLAMGISEDDGKKVITAIAKGELPDCRIYY
ncbi:coil containing protein [Vibrio phage 1.087.A._10N.261.45.F9]|nr:coil containing protein [Vibrio phage 1.087.A._10N.261.45.F9]